MKGKVNKRLRANYHGLLILFYKHLVLMCNYCMANKLSIFMKESVWFCLVHRFF